MAQLDTTAYVESNTVGNKDGPTIQAWYSFEVWLRLDNLTRIEVAPLWPFNSRYPLHIQEPFLQTLTNNQFVVISKHSYYSSASVSSSNS